MTTHDKYDNDILKQLTRIANSLEKIEKSLILSPNESRPKNGCRSTPPVLPKEIAGMFGELFPWTKEAGERLKAETDGIIKAAVDKELHNAIIPDSNQSSFSVKDLEEAMKHYDPNDRVKTHVIMMKED